MARNQTYYEVLGVSPDVDIAAIRKAYRKLALLHHPDKDNSPDATAKFQQINHAYEVLSSPSRKAMYDQTGTDGAVVEKEEKAPLIKACDRGDLAEVVHLVQEGCEDIDVVDSTLRTPLMYAAGKGHTSIINFLVEAKADLDASNCAGHTALFFAVGAKYGAAAAGFDPVPVLTALIVAKANVNAATCYGLTALMLACTTGHRRAVGTLIHAKADPCASSDIGLTPMVFAADRGHSEIVAVLLRALADPDARQGDGKTALMSACRLAHESVVEVLLDASANTNLRTREGWSALLYATERSVKDGLVCPAHSLEKLKTPAVVSHLLRAAAEVNVQDEKGRTPIFMAAIAGDTVVAGMLLKARADPRCFAADGRNAIMVAQTPEIKYILETTSHVEHTSAVTIEPEHKYPFEISTENAQSAKEAEEASPENAPPDRQVDGSEAARFDFAVGIGKISRLISRVANSICRG